MKANYLLLLSLIIGLSSFAQRSPEESNSLASITQELSKWDNVRGLWLAKSVEALSNNERIPERTFPENFTPHQMMRMVPADSRSRLLDISLKNRSSDRVLIQLHNIVNSVGCETLRGRSYGDPHLVSYDGARYSFQTVGEFVLTKSDDSQMEVQTRQKPQKQDFSLNTAVAMNVSGDRVCIYASDYPDSDYSTPVRVNGLALRMTRRTYFLKNGGTIRKDNNKYTVHWPTGESVNTKVRQSGNMDFLDVGVSIIPCSRLRYEGLMGNANGSELDDYTRSYVARRTPDNPFGNQGYGSKERQASLARQFAEEYRITQFNSLFDYRPGTSTETYTDRSFPRVFHDMNDLNQRTISRSRKNCEQQGISNSDMQGCIYDNAYLSIRPTSEPLFVDPTDGIELRPVGKPMVNDNQGTRPFIARPVFDRKDAELKKDSSSKPQSEMINPIENNDKLDSPINEIKRVKEVPVIKPVSRPPAPRPVILRPSPRPITVPSSRPKPRKNSSPKPKLKSSKPTKGRG